MLLHALLVTFSLLLAQPTATPAPTLKRSIPLPAVSGRIDHLAYDPKTKHLFIAALEHGSLEVVDLEKGERIKSITGLKEPQGIAFIPATDQVIISCGGDGTIRAYDAATLEPKQKTDLGEDADNMRLAPDGQHIIIGYGSGAIAILDVHTLDKRAEVKLSGHPEAFEPEPGTNRIFVNIPGSFVGGGGEVAVCDRSTQTVTATWKLSVAGRNFPMALDASHKRLYIGARRSAKLLVLDTDTGKTIASPECIGDADEVFIDPKSGRTYIVGGDGAIDVFTTLDQSSYTRAASVKTASGARTGLLIPNLHALFIAVPARRGQQAEIREYTIPD